MAANGSDFFKGFLLGGALGAVLALLYAPKTGKEMREDIKRRVEDLVEEADKELARAQKRAEDIIESGKVKAEKLRKEAEELAARTRESAASTLNAGKDKAVKGVEEKRAPTKERVAGASRSLRRKASTMKKAIDAGVQAFDEEKKKAPTSKS